MSRHALETLQTWLSPAVAALAQEDQHEEKTSCALPPILRSLSSLSCADTPPGSCSGHAPHHIPPACVQGPKAPERVAAAPCATPCDHGNEAPVCFDAERKRSFAPTDRCVEDDPALAI